MGIRTRFTYLNNAETDALNDNISEIENYNEEFISDIIEQEPKLEPVVVNVQGGTDLLASYIADETISKIIVLGNVAKIFRNDVFEDVVKIENIHIQSYIRNETCFRYVTMGFLVTGVMKPIATINCVTFERIKKYSPTQLVQKNIYSAKTVDFIVKVLLARKNILLACDDNASLLNTICKYIIQNRDVTFLYDLNKVDIAPNMLSLNLSELDTQELEYSFNVAIKAGAEYLIADLNEFKTGKLVSKTHELMGKIYSLPTLNAQSSLLKLQNLIMIEEHCNEKIAKSKILNSFDYIIDKKGIHVISPAKTAILTLCQLPD